MERVSQAVFRKGNERWRGVILIRAQRADALEGRAEFLWAVQEHFLVPTYFVTLTAAQEQVQSFRYSRSHPNSTKWARFCDHNNFLITTPIIKLFLIEI